jgi:hypothetical protein
MHFQLRRGVAKRGQRPPPSPVRAAAG